MFGLGVIQRTTRFRELGIASFPVAVLHHPARAAMKHLIEIGRTHFDAPLRPGAAWDITKNLVDQCFELRAHLRFSKCAAHQTDAAVVAEGIETSGELDTLIELGVGHGQGYLLGRPRPLSSSVVG